MKKCKKKIQKNISTKTKVKVIMITLILISAISYGCNDVDSSKAKTQSAVKKTAVNPPDLDIHAAALMGDLVAIQQHIEAGSDLDQREPNVGSSPLITAAVFGRIDVAKALIDAGADINFQNNQGSTPLHCAAFFCYTDIVEVLLEKGADKTLKNNFGSTALESVSGPFNDVINIYERFSRDLGPLGLKLDYTKIRDTRPRIAGMLQ